MLINDFKKDDIIKMKRYINELEFNIILSNQAIQHCFIEFMGKENAQNIISFYLNANMYRQFALKELNQTEISEISEIKQALKDFAKGLINSYLLNYANSEENDLNQVIYNSFLF